MKRWRGKAEWLLFAAVLLVLFILWFLLKDTTIDVLMPKGVIAEQQRTLFIVATTLSLLVVVPVFFMLGLFALKYRADKAHDDYQPEWKENSKLEMIWWGVPMVIIGILAVITWQTSHSLDPYKKIEANHPAVTVEVVALRWKWLFIYPDEGLATVNYLTMPKDVPVHFKLTADAPMSAFWIPALGSQIYNMNGMTSELNLLATENGTYTGYSTNINGTGYADMKFDVDVIPHDKFHDWVDAQRAKHLQPMDQDMFDTLRAASTGDPRTTYYLADPDLYNNVIGLYMNHLKMSTQPASNDDTMYEDMDHGGHH